MNPDVDVAILGAGCAGLSLAVALAEHAPSLQVQVLEHRASYQRDRTWCFWNTAPHPFEAGVTHRWDSWRLRHKGVEARQHSARYSYQYLPSDRFYDLSCTRLQCAGFALQMGVAVSAVQQVADLCEVETNRGSLRARWVFDSRPPAPGELRPMLSQRFLGWHVRCERPCFDASVVDLMDFQSHSENGRTAFFYVLPFSAVEALVEATFFEDPALPEVNAAPILQAYLHQLCGDQYEVLYQEASTLPMGDWRPRPPARANVIDIGIRGGRLKPSSGYAFQRIQRQSQAFARALSNGRDLPRAIEPRIYGILDRVFLQALLRSPDRVAAYFFALFKEVSPEALVRFLSETASAGEMLQVMLALPKVDFLRAAFASAGEGQIG